MLLKSPELLDQLRANAGLTQTQLAAQAVTRFGRPPSRQLISLYCLGKRRSASRALAESLAAALEVDVNLLFTPTISRGTRDSLS